MDLTHILTIVLAVLFVAVLAVQAYMLVRVRRSLTQVGQFMKMMNRVFRELSQISTQSAVIAVNNQELIKKIKTNSVKTNRKNSCLDCKHRMSFLKIDGQQLEFNYQCKLSKEAVTLNHYCPKFEIDVPQTTEN